MGTVGTYIIIYYYIIDFIYIFMDWAVPTTLLFGGNRLGTVGTRLSLRENRQKRAEFLRVLASQTLKGSADLRFYSFSLSPCGHA